MKGFTLLVLCALALARGHQIQYTSRGRLCNCDPNEANNVCSQIGSDDSYIVHENCNQYYRCVHGVPVTQTCASGLVYNPYNERCDFSANVDCGDKPILEVDDKPIIEENNQGSGVCYNCNPSDAPQICANGPDGVLIIHENCNQYYQCVHGSPVTLNCAPNTVYNHVTGTCDWPLNIDCGGRPIIEIEAVEPDLNESDQDEECSGWSCYCDPAEAPSICAEEGSDGTIIAHENCNQFYQCVHGKPVTLSCIPGLVFNLHIGQCDWLNSATCGNRPIIEIDEGEVSDEQDVIQEQQSCNCNASEAPSICSKEDSEGELIIHENCNQFYICDHGVPVTQNCPTGLHYDPFLERCEWPHTVVCGDRPIVDVGDGGNGGDEDCEDNNGQGGNGGEEGNGGEGGNGGNCNCNANEAPAICSKEDSEGVLIIHENCNQYYICDHGIPVTQNCPEGLMYDPYLERCEWSHTVECGERPIVEIEEGGNGGGSGNGGQDNGQGGNGGEGGNEGTCNCNANEAPAICSKDDSEGVLIIHENCNQYYICDHGIPVTQNCPEGLMYDPYLERCEWSHTVECGERPIVEIEEGANGSGSGNGGQDNGQGGNGGEGGNGGTCNCNANEAPAICSKDDSEGVLIIHENCNQYYICDHGVPVTQNCPKGLMYHPYLERCEWSHTVECGERPIVEIEEGGNGGGSGNGGQDNGQGGNGGEGGNEGTCNCNANEAPAICSKDDSEGVLIIHENCNQYYICDHGIPVTQNCPEGLMYDPYLERCEWSHTVECGERPIVEIEEGGNGGGSGNGGQDNGQGGNGGEGGNEGTCNCNANEAPAICSKDDSEGVLIIHENCNQYYICDHGIPVTQNCPEGLMYDPYLERCEWSHTVECGERPIVEIEEGANGSGSGNGGQDNGQGGNGGEGGNGGTCNCNANEAPAICSKDDSEGVLIIHENCNQYYICDHGVPVTQNCPEGLMYHPYLERCEWSHTVECGERPIVEIEEGGNGGGSGNGGQDNGQGGNGGEGGNGGTCNCNANEAPAICSKDDSEGVLIIHENCNQYYICDHGIPVTQNCPEGLMYDPYLERCEWSHTVECGERPIVEIEEGGNGGGSGNGSQDNGQGGNGGEGGNGGTCNCNANEAPAICSKEDSEGVLIIHENCNQYYICDHGIPVTQNCPEGLMYDPYLERCEWPHTVECGERPIVEIEEGGNGDDSGNGGQDNGQGGNGGEGGNGGTCNCNANEAPAICSKEDSEGVLIIHENCNQYYICDHGIPVTQNCPEGLMYDPYLERCEWPHTVECGERPIVEIEEGGNGGGPGNGGQDNGQGGNGGEGGNGGTCNCNANEAPAICSKEDSEGVLIIHENCNQYYICDHGIPVTQNCPEGLMYDPYLERCEWPHTVECGERPVVEIEEGGNGGGSGNGGQDNGQGGNGGEGGNGGTCNCNANEAPAICSKEDSEGVLIIHENCNQYYICDHGIPVTQNCPEGLMYDPYLERCEWPHTVECGERPIVEIEEGGNGGGSGNGGQDNGQGGNGGEGGNGGTCNCNANEAPAICSKEDSEGVLIIHENCNQYYICDHGIPVTQNCPEGLMYDPYLERCEWPHTVECGERPIVEIEEGGNGGGSGNGGQDNGQGGNGGEGGNGGTCNCNANEAPAICSKEDSEGVLIIHENCNQYYICDHGIPVTQNCPEGLMYDPFLERCEWPHTVECGERPIVEIEGGGNGGGSGNGGQDNGQGGNGGEGGNGGTCNCNANEAPAICSKEDSEGVLIIHENCNQYYICDHGIPVTQNCPEGLMYDPFLERCEWPHTVECGERPIVEIEGGGNGGGSGNGGQDNGQGGNGGEGGNGGTCNCNANEAPAICSKEDSEGVLIIHENCNQYYICDHGIPVTQNCPEGLMYDPYLERCEWSHTVECGERPIVEIEGGGNGGGSGNGGQDNGQGGNGGEGGNGGTCNCNANEAPAICSKEDSEGVLIIHENCNQYYICDHGIPVTQNCPEGLMYDPYLERCEWSHTVECGERPIVEIEGGGNGGGSGNGGQDNGQGGNGGEGGNGGTCNCNANEAPAICSKEDSEGVLIIHENCNQYYICDHGIPVTQNCPEGLMYDPYLERCEWSHTVECGERPIVEIEGGGNGGGSGNGGQDNGQGGNGGEGGNGGTCNCNANEAPAICSKEDSEGVLIIHENCNQYYICDHGIPVTQNCPSGLHYDPYLERCEWPITVDCGDRPIVEVEDGNSGGNGGESGNGGQDNENEGDGSQGGSGNDDNAGDADSDCDENHNNNDVNCNCNPNEAANICRKTGATGTFIAHENCNQFYQCDNGLPVAKYCPLGLVYNPYIANCDWPYNVNCNGKPIVDMEVESKEEESNEEDATENEKPCNCNPAEAPAICAGLGAEGVLVAHEKCNYFYQCFHGKPTATKCAAGTLYNPYIARCDWPTNVECGNRTISDSSEEEDSPNPENNIINGHNDPSQAPAICAAENSNDVLVAHENCNQYYICQYGLPVAFHCPRNLLYNPTTEQCDWPNNVNCNGREEPNDGNGEVECACNARLAPIICSDIQNTGKLIAHEICNHYYVCIKGTPTAFSCPTPLLYDPHKEVCNWASAVDCEGRTVTSYYSLNKHLKARKGLV